MGGRGTYATGRKVTPTYQTVGHINGVPVLQPDASRHGTLPEEAHSSNAYILLDSSGEFKMYREYDTQHNLRIEIAYHYETALVPRATGRILHIHEYDPTTFKRTPARLLTECEYRRYKPYFKGELKWKK